MVMPADGDPLVADATERIGGRSGTHRGRFIGFLSPIRAVVLMASISFTVGYLIKLPCVAESFSGDAKYTRMCYSDIPFLYQLRGFADGWLPYVQTGNGQGPPLEYPVLTGGFMQIASWLTGRDKTALARSIEFYDWNALLLLICLLVTVVCTALTVRRRPWDAALLALAPGVVLCSIINWDLLAVAFTSASMLAWSRRRVGWAGVLLGLAVASKFYPLVLMGPLFLLCLRSGRMRAFWIAGGAGLAAWALVNLPVFLINHQGWMEFYSFSSTRGADWGSLWYLLMIAGHVLDPGAVNVYALGLLSLLCAAIAIVALTAPRRPRYAQLAFLVLAAFCICNKVYSPQYVLWLIPLAAMARPRWRDFLLWQICEVLYFGAIWWFLQQFGTSNKGLPDGWYNVSVAVHLLATAWFAAMVVRDIYRPQHDPVRSDGQPDDRDDPGGGVLDGAADDFTLRTWREADSRVGAHESGAADLDVDQWRGEPPRHAGDENGPVSGGRHDDD